MSECDCEASEWECQKSGCATSRGMSECDFWRIECLFGG